MTPCNILEYLEALTQNGDLLATGKIDPFEYFKRRDEIAEKLEKNLNDNCPFIKPKEVENVRNSYLDNS